MTDQLVSIVIPILNEQGNLNDLIRRVDEALKDVAYEIIFVDDGSTDETLEEIKRCRVSDKRIRFISFSRNFGHQIALRAGLDFAGGDCVITMDGDLQHPPELIRQMLQKWAEGADVVYTIREDGDELGYLKSFTSRLFYAFINRISDVEIQRGSADFRLLSKRVVNALRQFKESSVFYRGLIPWLGFRQIGISYVAEPRTWGRTKYSMTKMIRLALTGITGFSVRPLHLSTILGLTMAGCSFLYGAYAVCLKVFTEETIPGWTSLLLVVTMIGGIQLVMIGILGEYLGKLFMESKSRPPYLIKERELE